MRPQSLTKRRYAGHTSATFWDVNSKVCELLPEYTAPRPIKQHFFIATTGRTPYLTELRMCLQNRRVQIH